MLSTTLASFAECEMDFYNVLVTYETAIRDNVRMKLKIVNPSMTEECRTTILDQGRALEVFDIVIRADGPLTRGPYDEWPPKIISRKWLSCHDGKAMFSHEKFHLCCSMQQRVYFEFSIRRRVQRRRRMEVEDGGGKDAPPSRSTMTTSTTHQKIPVFLRRHIFSFLPIFEDERNWLDDKWLRPFRVAVKGEEVDRGKQRRKKRCCRICCRISIS